MYDGILFTDMHENSYLVGYADDISAFITTRAAEDAQRKLKRVIIRTQTWMVDRGLRLAVENMGVIILTRRHIPVGIPVQALGNTFQTKRTITYLVFQIVLLEPDQSCGKESGEGHSRLDKANGKCRWTDC